ncbi:MAG: hypothetical protein KAG14_05255, partial [Mycoplasmataceae bacterium]|nr:hypothetical protein [Mycoplasmataceae bacterium]
MNIDRETFQNLGFASIIEKLSQLSYSKESSALLSTQQFINSKFDLEEYLQVISDLKDIYDIESHPALYFPEISSIFKDLKPENSVVDGLKLYNIGQFYKNSAQFRDYLLQPREIFEQKEPSFLKHIPNEIPVDYSLILSTFNSEGEIFDSHPDVINLINDKSSLNSEISKLTNNILKDDEQFWQDKRAVYRNGRMLLPLKSNFKGRIKGVIHDVSSTGGTLFIEPFEMFNLNNRLVELENKKKIIKLKWIKYFSQQLHDELYALQSVYKMILELDTINARARYSNLYNCTRASVSSNFNLKATIHPELGENAVPINIIFDKNCKMVIISGPNAGGKTVSLKTAALAVLMNQFGMFIHALDDSSLPLFKTVFTAIGDNQSIE